MSQTTTGWRNAYHLTVPDHWKNDPQRPIWAQDAYQYFYLYNADYPQGHGTAWRRASTVDGVRFTDEGVSLPKHTQPNGDLWSGSLVVDHHDTAGFGAGAVVALVTQPDRVGADGAQAQFLWYSTDDGSTFTNLSDTPVMPNPGRADYRDPKIVWDATRQRWVCVLAEGHELGLYTSTNLRDWTERSRFTEDRYGILECPDLFSITADDGSDVWVLAASVNEVGPANPGTFGYWTGTFDGTSFTADRPDPEWLDHGFDWYAAVTWPVHEDGQDSTTRRWAIAWMNNWAYANTTPTLADEGFNGVDSVVRELQLRRAPDGRYRLHSQPVSALDGPTLRSHPALPVGGGAELEPAGRSFQLHLTLTGLSDEPSGVRVRMSESQDRYLEVGATRDQLYVDRGATGEPSGGMLTRCVVNRFEAAGTVQLRILVDHTTLEVFSGDGLSVLSMLAFPPAEDTGIAVFGTTGTADLLIAAVPE